MHGRSRLPGALVRNAVIAGMVVGLASTVFADEPDSVAVPVRQRPTATAPT